MPSGGTIHIEEIQDQVRVSPHAIRGIKGCKEPMLSIEQKEQK